MKRKIHTIYDIILKMIIMEYSDEFLKFIGVKKSIKKILKTEFVTKKGRRLHLDFLCELIDGTLLNIEFQFTDPDGKDLNRFYDYNIFSQTEHNKLCETIIISFKTSMTGQKSHKIGKTKTMHPLFFYLGSIDFMKRLNNIENKIENNINLTNNDEISLMLMCLLPKFTNKQEILEKICTITKNETLLDKTKISILKAVIGLEIENFVNDKNKQKTLLGELNMTPESKKMMYKAIDQAIEKSIQLEREHQYNTGKKDGIKEGKIKGIKEEKIEIAKKLKGKMAPEEIAKITGLTLTAVLKL